MSSVVTASSRGRGEHGREAEGAVAHRLVEERLHRLELVRVGPGERVAQDAAQQRPEPDVAGDVHRDPAAPRARRSSRPGSSRRRCRRAPSTAAGRRLPLGGPGRGVLAEDLGRDALADLALGVAVLEQQSVGMRVHVDEPGRDDQPAASMTRRARALGADAADRGDPVAADRHVAVEPGVAGAVDDPAAADQDIEGSAGPAVLGEGVELTCKGCESRATI